MRFVGIDPATVTGFVALDEDGNVLVEEELGKSKKGGLTISQLVLLEEQIAALLRPNEDVIAIETPGMATQRAITTGYIHGGIRSMLYRLGLDYTEFAPTQVKSFVGVTGWTGVKGNKRRLVDKEKKAAVKAAVLERLGYTHSSDNVIDAYIIARMSLEAYKRRSGA